jgi:hypothetical protein
MLFSKLTTKLWLFVALLLLVVILVVSFFAWDIVKTTQNSQAIVQETSHRIILQETQQLGKIELTRFIYKDVVEHSKSSGNAFMPTAKVILIVSGEAVGCIDLMRLREEDITQQGDSLFILLPAPELCYHKIDHQKSKVYNTEYIQITGETKLVGEAFKKAEVAIKEAAIENGILTETQRNAELMLRPIFEKVTGKRVFFQYSLATQLKPKD